MVRIGDKEYVYDEFGNLHRYIDYIDYGKIVDYYRKRVYLDGGFRSNKIINDEPDYLTKLINIEYKRSETKADRIIRMTRTQGSLTDILDLGCGAGFVLDSLAQRGAMRCEGWDVSLNAKKLEHNLINKKEIKIITQEAFHGIQIEKRPKRWKYVIALDIIEHVNFDRLLLCLIRDRLIKKGGKSVIEIPVFETRDIDQIREADFVYPEHHLHLYSVSGFISVAESCGWNILDSEIHRGGKKATYVMEAN